MTSQTCNVDKDLDAVTSEVNNFIRQSTDVDSLSKLDEKDQIIESVFTFTQPIWWKAENNR